MNLILQAIKSLFRKLENSITKKLSDLENDLKLSTSAIGTKLIIKDESTGELLPKVVINSSDAPMSFHNNEVVFDVAAKRLLLRNNVFPFGGRISIGANESMPIFNVGDSKQYSTTDTRSLEILSNLSNSDSCYAVVSINFLRSTISTIITRSNTGVATGLCYFAGNQLYGITVEYTDTSATVTVTRIM